MTIIAVLSAQLCLKQDEEERSIYKISTVSLITEVTRVPKIL